MSSKRGNPIGGTDNTNAEEILLYDLETYREEHLDGIDIDNPHMYDGPSYAWSDEDREYAVEELKEIIPDQNEVEYILDKTKELGFGFVSSQHREDGTRYAEFELGNQSIEVDKDVLHKLATGDKEYALTMEEFFNHISNDVPDLLKFNKGIVYVKEDTGNYYNPRDGSIHVDATSLKKEYADTQGNFKNVLEHELSHRLDYMGTSKPVISEHPYLKVLATAFPSTGYSAGYKITKDNRYGTENFAELLAPQGTLRSGLTQYQKGLGTFKTSYDATVAGDPRLSKGKWVARPFEDPFIVSENASYRDYDIMLNPINSNVGYMIHGMNTPREVLNYLDKEYEMYLRNNS